MKYSNPLGVDSTRVPLGQHISTLKGKEKQMMLRVVIDGAGGGGQAGTCGDSYFTDLSVFQELQSVTEQAAVSGGPQGQSVLAPQLL